MYRFKGFVQIETLVSNILNEIAPVGELSSHAMTFAKDKTIHESTVNRSITLYGFSSKNDIVAINEPSVIINKGLEIAEWIVTKQKSTASNQLKIDFFNSFTAKFLPTCDGLDCGEMIADSDNNVFPEWITWKSRNYVTTDNINKIWFCDNSFRSQYDEYEIIIVPPIMNIDNFFSGATAVKIAVNARSFSTALESIRAMRGDYPETALSADVYDYYNPLNPTDRVPTNWSVLIYGPAGNGSDLVMDAIVEYITTHSTHTVDEWKLIFPDLFKRTEFIILPRWHNYAVATMTLDTGIYSPIVNIKKELIYLKTILPEYSPAHIEMNATILFNPYKSLALDIVGSIDNRDSIVMIDQKYPDIISVSTTSNDFNRMSSSTQGFLNLLSNMLPAAEYATASTVIPIGMRRTTRNGIIYLVANYDRVQWLVSCKSTTPHY